MAAFATQVLAIPIAIRYCGLDTYALYLSLVAASLAPSILLLRLGPSFISSVAKFHRLDDRHSLSAYFRNSIGLTSLNCVAAGLLSVAAFCLLPVDHFFKDLSAPGTTIVPTLAVLSFLSITGCFLSTVEAYQAGLHETHVLYVRSTVSNGLAIALLFVIIPFYPSVVGLLIVLQVVPFVTRLLNAAFFIWRQRMTLLLPSGDRTTNILGDAVRYTFMAGFCAYTGTQVPLLILTTQSNTNRAGLYAVAIQLVLQLQGVIAVMMAPTVPAIANALAAGEVKTVRRIQQGSIWLTNCVGMLVACASAILSQWFELSTGISYLARLSIALSAGLFFWSMAIESVLLSLLLTRMSGRSSNAIYVSQGIRSISVALAALTFTVAGLDLWAFLAMAVCSLFVAIIPLLRILRARDHMLH
ncbi:MAG: hypothetical protein IT422_25485 [Pirellulaceae bacterium]|nr:hypothetical protein [Pirellulaceae bacterium]